MRIAILADPLDNQNAGIHVFTREMVKSLIQHKGSHEIILVRERIDPDLQGIEQIRVPNIRLPIGFASIRLFFLIPLILHFKKVDVVVEPAHFGPFNLLPWIKRVTIIHDLTPILFKHFHRWHSQFLQNTFLKGILKRTDLVLANSDNTARDVERVYPFCKGKVKRIYPGADAIYEEKHDPDVLKRLGIDAPYFLNVGTIEPRKNLVCLLEAYKLFRDDCPERIQLVVAGGKGWKTGNFDEVLAVHPYKNDIIETGYMPLEDMPALFSDAIALVYPSIYEGFGLPILESLRCGTPVITSSVSSLPEVAGDAGLYAKPNDILGFKEHMSSLHLDGSLRHALKQKAAMQVQKFSWNEFAKEMLASLEQLKK